MTEVCGRGDFDFRLAQVGPLFPFTQTREDYGTLNHLKLVGSLKKFVFFLQHWASIDPAMTQLRALQGSSIYATRIFFRTCGGGGERANHLANVTSPDIGVKVCNIWVWAGGERRRPRFPCKILCGRPPVGLHFQEKDDPMIEDVVFDFQNRSVTFRPHVASSEDVRNLPVFYPQVLWSLLSTCNTKMTNVFRGNSKIDKYHQRARTFTKMSDRCAKPRVSASLKLYWKKDYQEIPSMLGFWMDLSKLLACIHKLSTSWKSSRVLMNVLPPHPLPSQKYPFLKYWWN